MKTTELNNQRYILILSVLLICGTLLYILRSVLLPFVVGIVVAYFFDPLVNKLCSHTKMSRGIATTLVLFTFMLLLLPLFLLFGSFAYAQISDLITNLPNYIDASINKVNNLLEQIKPYLPEDMAVKQKNTWLGGMNSSFKPIINIAQTIISNGFELINLLSLLLISPVVAFYMLRDWHNFTDKIYGLIPQKQKKTVVDGINAVDRIISGYLRGQFMVCIILGSYYSFGLWLINLRLGILVGFLAGLISFIPYVGSISGFLLAMILVITQYGTMPKIAAVITVFAIGQFIEGNILTPKLVGENIGLHPVWVMFALLAGGVLLGLLGMIIAVPVAACIGVWLRYMVENYKNSAIYLEK